jgi:membrane-bound ClpP family serine protease
LPYPNESGQESQRKMKFNVIKVFGTVLITVGAVLLLVELTVGKFGFAVGGGTLLAGILLLAVSKRRAG